MQRVSGQQSQGNILGLLSSFTLQAGQAVSLHLGLVGNFKLVLGPLLLLLQSWHYQLQTIQHLKILML